MESQRQIKVGKQIQKDLSEIILELSKEVAPGKMLTVTKVRITPDLGLAKTYVSVFPSTDADAIVQKLNDKLSLIRHELGKRIRHQLKKVPELKIYNDDSLDYMDNIDKLLHN